MAQEVLMPKAGNSVESCILLEWKKEEGEAVSIGDILCEAETDKATIEVESTAEGILLKKLFEVDDDVPVQVPIAVIGEAGETVEVSSAPQSESEAPAAEAAPAETVVNENPTADSVVSAPASEGAFASPRAKRLAAEKGIPVAAVPASGPKGRVIERDVEAVLAGRQPLTPVAAALSGAGAEVPASGAGIGGRVRYTDLRQAQQSTASPAVEASSAFPGSFREIPVRSIRKITAERMLQSVSTTSQLTLHTSANAVTLLELRKRFKQSAPELGFNSVSINDLMLFAVSRTVKQFPFANSHFLGDKIIEFDHVHLGQAVDTERGLMVPVLKFADTLSIRDLAAESRALAGSCKEGKAAPELFEGGTFTVTNLGGMGIEKFTPVLNIPQTAILGINTIELKPVDTNGEVKFIPHIGLSLTFDHQAFDGAPAARFLQALCRNITDIDLMVMGACV